MSFRKAQLASVENKPAIPNKTAKILGVHLANVLLSEDERIKKEVGHALLDAGADPTGTMALFGACQFGDLDLIRRIAAFEPSIASLEEAHNTSTLLFAFKGHSRGQIPFLIEAGATLGLIGQHPSSGLHCWAEDGAPEMKNEILEAMLSRGASFELKTATGWTPFQIAVVFKRASRVKLLASKGAHLVGEPGEIEEFMQDEADHIVSAYEEGAMLYTLSQNQPDTNPGKRVRKNRM